MIYGITLILLSIIAVPSLILAKKPNAKELLDKIEPYQGWIGLVFCLGGIWGIISAFLNIAWLTSLPIWWSTLLAGSFVQATLGFMLGFGMISKLLLSKNEAAKEKGEALREKLAPKLGKLGLFGLIVGGWMIVASILFI
ncbi:hypothetical protein J2Q11_07870 [Tenacibaculum finnmarkense genomovar finnmarkense]|uniref:hypothetical protein n=1 Tax=Tenacibaculum finnmarkense TaxID=2781243 RepID=UPI001E353D50|nr:hypothetical protein [Tenacibaculum finnmarkense]MCD8417581.1 hypothetical protein [Tenacibaculum finnmarkense genomovar finnmarkense]MCG8185980.1 hypothetical protein [Tenacibaculum finnmarkense genomovar finnmarkense]MCG8202520.1 hypothetical protein [Tenacibaculum finnmarkense genomovar finnmarkense]MCG8209821.1 hypothetical protein [Tenacibaculum finnmarkense genomovar finnmarkense]MCG8212721.1 hypothetical protein [Tenacibaculum finnmarkense genomovar finnmarkense]